MDKDTVIKVIRSLVISSDDADFRTIIKDYREEAGEPIPFRKFGYASLEAFLRASSEFILIETANGIKVSAKKSQSSAHIIDMRQHQARSKKRSAKRKPFAPTTFTQTRRPPVNRQSNYTNYQRNNVQPFRTPNRNVYNPPARPAATSQLAQNQMQQMQQTQQTQQMQQIQQKQQMQQLHQVAKQYHDDQRAIRFQQLQTIQQIQHANQIAGMVVAMQQRQIHQSIVEKMNIHCTPVVAQFVPQAIPLVRPMTTISAPKPELERCAQYSKIVHNTPMQVPNKAIDEPLAKSSDPISNTTKLTPLDRLEKLLDDEERQTPSKSDIVTPIVAAGKERNRAATASSDKQLPRCSNGAENARVTSVCATTDDRPKSASGGFHAPHPLKSLSELRKNHKSPKISVNERLIIQPTEPAARDSNSSMASNTVIKPKPSEPIPSQLSTSIIAKLTNLLLDEEARSTKLSLSTSPIVLAGKVNDHWSGKSTVGNSMVGKQSLFGSNASLASEDAKPGKMTVNHRLTKKAFELSNGDDDLAVTSQLVVLDTSVNKNVDARINSFTHKQTSIQANASSTLCIITNNETVSRSTELSAKPSAVMNRRQVFFAPRPLKPETMNSSLNRYDTVDGKDTCSLASVKDCGTTTTKIDEMVF